MTLVFAYERQLFKRARYSSTCILLTILEHEHTRVILALELLVDGLHCVCFEVAAVSWPLLAPFVGQYYHPFTDEQTFNVRLTTCVCVRKCCRYYSFFPDYCASA